MSLWSRHTRLFFSSFWGQFYFLNVIFGPFFLFFSIFPLTNRKWIQAKLWLAKITTCRNFSAIRWQHHLFFPAKPIWISSQCRWTRPGGYMLKHYTGQVGFLRQVKNFCVQALLCVGVFSLPLKHTQETFGEMNQEISHYMYPHRVVPCFLDFWLGHLFLFQTFF